MKNRILERFYVTILCQLSEATVFPLCTIGPLAGVVGEDEDAGVAGVLIFRCQMVSLLAFEIGTNRGILEGEYENELIAGQDIAVLYAFEDYVARSVDDVELRCAVAAVFCAPVEMVCEQCAGRGVVADVARMVGIEHEGERHAVCFFNPCSH